MALNIDQFESRLRDGLAPVYLIAGDEPLLIQEAADRVWAKAREKGFSEREIMSVTPGFDWGRLRESGAKLSLFASRRLLELRLSDAKPGSAGSRALKDHAASPPPDTVLLVLAGALDRKARSSSWFKALEGAGEAVYCWPVKAHRLPGWVVSRMRGAGLSPDTGAAEELAMLTEGNLMAADQAVSRLALLYPRSRIAPEQVRECIADNARFTVFDVVDKVLAGKVGPALRSLDRLREESAEPLVVLWVLARELRGLAGIFGRMAHGKSMDQALAAERVWSWRKRLVSQAVQRLDEPRVLALLQLAARADRVTKGMDDGRPWEELVNLCVGMASES